MSESVKYPDARSHVRQHRHKNRPRRTPRRRRSPKQRDHRGRSHGSSWSDLTKVLRSAGSSSVQECLASQRSFGGRTTKRADLSGSPQVQFRDHPTSLASVCKTRG